MDQLSSTKPDMFEQATRQLRWATVIVVLFTFPSDAAQTASVYLLLLALVAYNTLRYVTALHAYPAFRSPAFSMVADIIFAGSLVTFTGNISTPYTAFFVFLIITSAYLYQMKGVVVVTAIEAAILLFMSSVAPFTSITPEPWQTISITLFALLAFGYLVTQLTRGERQEKNSLLQLRLVSDKERSRLLALVDSLHVAILVTNQKGKIIQHNEAARDLAGISARLSGNRIQDEFRFFRRDDPKKKPVYLFNDDDIGQHRRDLSIMTRENTRLDLDITVTPVWHDGINTEYIVVCEDISKERPLEELRSSFISVASHELRTPIAVIEAALQSALISKESLAPQIAAIIEQAHRSTLHLSDIVKDLSLLAEAENDTLPVNLTQVNPDQLLTQCVADFSSQVNQKGLKLKKVVVKGTPSVLSTEHHIREILQNLVTNALKYSEKGTVTLKAEPASNGGVRFSVQDQGVGIEPGDQKFLFTKFFRAENYLTQSTSGTGLGLYLCMELADRLGARIWFKSAPRKGSTFYLEVPSQSATSRSSLIETAASLAGPNAKSVAKQ